MKILITGDLVINREYCNSNINDSIISLFNQSDLNIVNLEAPVTTSTSKIIKTGPHLKADKNSTLQILKSLKVDVVTLANNHVLDYDEQGVGDTLEFCKENNIKTVGAGMNLKEASQTLYIDSDEGKIAIINFAENEWASATDESAGAHPMDIIDNAKEIKNAKEKADYVFVIVHGGHEHYNLPSPKMQKLYRFYAEQGADIVVGHHTHCISGNEVYNGVPIYYSLGNFLYPLSYIQKDKWYIGLIVEIKVFQKKIDTKLHPICLSKETNNLSLLDTIKKQKVLEEIDEINKVIINPTELNNSWNQFLDKKEKTYLNYWSPFAFLMNRYTKYFLRKTGLTFINKKGIALYLNLMRCESHSETSQKILSNYLKDDIKA